MVAGEIVGVQEKADPAAGLVADGGLLHRPLGAGQHQTATAARRFHRHPAFRAHRQVFGQPKAERADVKGDGGVILRHDECHGA